MREILFRGKWIDNGEWVYGGYAHIYSNPNTDIIITGRLCVYEDRDEPTIEARNIDPSTIGQYTGLTDKNGEKIFEGDICKFREWDNGKMCWIGYVHFEHCQFIISGGANEECPSNFHLVLSRFSPENIEVIGNIHDNPELLEVEK